MTLRGGAAILVDGAMAPKKKSTSVPPDKLKLYEKLCASTRGRHRDATQRRSDRVRRWRRRPTAARAGGSVPGADPVGGWVVEIDADGVRRQSDLGQKP
jgi:hypothetical protein